MGDFFVPNPGGAAPPPEPDVPPPDFRNIGADISLGIAKTGVFGQFLKAFVVFSGQIVAGLVAGLVAIAGWIAAKFVGILTAADENSNPAYGQLTASTLQHIFGINVTPDQVSGRGATDKRFGAAQDIGNSVISAFFGNAIGNGPGALQPSDAAAKDYMGRVAHIGLEGWLESWIIDALSLHEFERFGDLARIMSDILGLSRLTRRVLAAPLKILVEDPYTWKLNDQYRPALLTHDIACKEYLRGTLQRSDLEQILGWQGFSSRVIDLLINHNLERLTDADIDYALERQMISSDDAVTIYRNYGFTADQASLKVNLLIDKRLDVYRKQMIAAASEAFVRKDIDHDQYTLIVQSSSLPDLDQQWIIKVAGMRREMEFKRLTLAEIERLIKAGIDNVDDLRTWMVRENYRPEEMDALELLLISQVQTKAAADQAKMDKAAATQLAALKKTQAAAAKQAALDAQLATKGVSLTAAKQLVKDGRWTFDQYTQFLQAHGAAPGAVTDLVGLLHDEIDTATKAAATRADAKATAAEKEIPLSQYEAGVKSGVFTLAQFQDFLKANNYGADDITSLVGLLQSELTTAANKAAAKTSATGKAAAKGISLAELERAVRLGIVPIASYQDALVKAGEDPTSIALLVGILQDQLAADQATAAKREDAALRAGKQGLSLAQTEQAVIDGIRPMSDYTLLLGKLGLDQTDVDALRELLQVRVDHAATVQSKTAAAQTAAATGGLSLAQVQRATKLGVLSLDQYTAILAKIGLTPDDQAILRTAMVVELQKIAAANNTRTAAASTLAKRGLSLATQETAVVDGITPIETFQSNLVAQGLADADVTTLVDLVTLKRDQAQAAAAKRAIAEQRAADKDPSLAKEEALVTAGVITMDDYAAYLAELGMDDLDIADLVALLTQKIAAAQTAAASAGNPPAPGAKVKKSRKKAAAVAPTAPAV